MVEQSLVLRMEGATKVYGSGERAVTALEDVSFEVRAGEVVVVMGPSGSGKTTLLTIAGALLRPTRGRVFICGTNVTEMDEGGLAAIRREKVGFVYQSFNLLAALTALENVRLVVREEALNGRAAVDWAREMLDTFGLSHRLHSLPKNLSDGEKQRVALARALAKDPALILADEPTANLDTKRGREVIRLLRQKALEMNKAVVIVSHDQRVREVAHRVVWLEDGRMRAGVETARDPVCGALVETHAALSATYLEGMYHFCDEQCLRSFEADPLKYVGTGVEPAP